MGCGYFSPRLLAPSAPTPFSYGPSQSRLSTESSWDGRRLLIPMTFIPTFRPRTLRRFLLFSSVPVFTFPFLRFTPLCPSPLHFSNSSPSLSSTSSLFVPRPPSLPPTCPSHPPRGDFVPSTGPVVGETSSRNHCTYCAQGTGTQEGTQWLSFPFLLRGV